MTLAAPSDYAATARISTGRLTSALLWLTVFSGGFVLFEPAPYELLFAILACSLLVKGIRFPALLALPIGFLTLWITSGILSIAVNGLGTKAATYIAVSAFLAVTTILIAALLAENPQRYIQNIRRAYIAAGLLSALAAVIGYFHLLPGSDMFVIYGRAKAMFKDPNVFAPFLIFPALLLFLDVLYSKNRKLIISSALFSILLIAILLSFSRASWGHMILSSLITVFLVFAKSKSNLLRLRIIGLGLFSVIAGGAAIISLLMIPAVSEIFELRFAITQDYDAGETGRFATQLRSLSFLLEAPFGFGPHGFADRFIQDSHNVYLNGFASYGWVGGFAYICFVISTCVAGVRYVLIRTPWQNFHIAAFATYFALSLEGFVIDTDHWRHYFLLAGLIWGLAAATISYRRNNTWQQNQLKF